jgi:long-chain fatty acid transport protein
MEARQAEVRAVDGATGTAVSMAGRIAVRNFQWPETYGLGIAYRANERVFLAADIKRINWADVMKDFKMAFEADAGGGLDLTLNQFWKNQNVLMLGGSFRMSDNLTLRAGLNLANNPVPDYICTRSSRQSYAIT